MTESLRSAFALRSAEVWTAGAGSLELAASDPERRSSPIPFGATEEVTVSRAGVSGPAWARLWLPGLLEGRPDAVLRIAPVTHSGELWQLDDLADDCASTGTYDALLTSAPLHLAGAAASPCNALAIR